MNFNQSPSDMWSLIQHSDFIDRNNNQKKTWAKNCERHQRKGLDD